MAWAKEDKWDRIAAEKRSVLNCMTQVLESCHTLLDSTQIPVDGIVRLLQHILRCACAASKISVLFGCSRFASLTLLSASVLLPDNHLSSTSQTAAAGTVHVG